MYVYNLWIDANTGNATLWMQSVTSLILISLADRVDYIAIISSIEIHKKNHFKAVVSIIIADFALTVVSIVIATISLLPGFMYATKVAYYLDVPSIVMLVAGGLVGLTLLIVLFLRVYFYKITYNR